MEVGLSSADMERAERLENKVASKSTLASFSSEGDKSDVNVKVDNDVGGFVEIDMKNASMMETDNEWPEYYRERFAGSWWYHFTHTLDRQVKVGFILITISI